MSEKQTEAKNTKQNNTVFQKPDLTRQLTDEEIQLLRDATGKQKVYEIEMSVYDEESGVENDFYFYQTMPQRVHIARYMSTFSSDIIKASNAMLKDTSLNDPAVLVAYFKKYQNGSVMVVNQLNRLTGLGGNASIKKR